ncbi:MAG: transposase [Bacteroidota bacterium]
MVSLTGDRKSKTVLHEIYFWTNSIKDWNKILYDDKLKGIIIESLRYLVGKNLIVVYAFVIMPNHVHIIWKMLKENGLELPIASFSKYTSHQFLANLKMNEPQIVHRLFVNESDRDFRIWNRDPLAVLMDSRKKIEQKIEYIHNNPIAEKWSLVSDPVDYYWSSAKFYETGIDHFGFLTHYMDEF